MRTMIILLVPFIFLSCREGKKNDPTPEPLSDPIVMDQSLEHGKKLVESECYVCHNPKAEEADMIAPPMVAVRSHYTDKKTTREEFSRSLTDWLNDPRPEKVKMRGAYRRFGIMPYQPYSEEDLRDISAYLYDSELPQPQWYEDHRRQGQGKGTGKGMMEEMEEMEDMEDEDSPYFPRATFYRNRGSEIAAKAQGVLGKNLVRAIQEKGTSGAISFCKVQAMSLTDSVGIMNNAIVKRVSDKPRNLQNRATAEETGYIIAFRRQLENQAKNQGEIRPILKEMGGEEVYYYSPIVTNAMCLQCHGKSGSEIQEPVLNTLRALYPADEARGYETGQVRGMWKIQFVKESQ
ncbi:Cytochrome c553 [Muriicola jejuensis]|uniref:DUF3365 domain-containing protein n=1 Tax=Muriicola jejuensis TaxID=504488 RepID=A0A6P0UCW5_9FLAO|nr:DUF3365 domain-containing protein [Muriicola jejuensis]NER10887.1 DUF3365 domain-containing protein [Muriicola jejuensis]SMP15847.1 Cytochrome c553 [Muriicola jejuensis]